MNYSDSNKLEDFYVKNKDLLEDATSFVKYFNKNLDKLEVLDKKLFWCDSEGNKLRITSFNHRQIKNTLGSLIAYVYIYKIRNKEMKYLEFIKTSSVLSNVVNYYVKVGLIHYSFI